MTFVTIGKGIVTLVSFYVKETLKMSTFEMQVSVVGEKFEG